MQSTGRTTLALPALTALVIGSMVGAGAFQLPARFAAESGVYGTLIVWLIAGTGTLSLALVFQTLAVRRPQLDNGVYVYARAGFGVYPGFLSAVGFWASSSAGNAFYLVLIMTTIGQLFPEAGPYLGQGNTWLSFALAAAAIWSIYLLIRRGVREAAIVNAIVTAAKVLPLLLFIVLAIIGFDQDVFSSNLMGSGAAGGSLIDQVRGTMLITVFVFLGVEGASVFSRYARTRSHVGKATVLGFCSVIGIFAAVTVLSFGILPRAEIAAAPQPSIGSVLEAAVGPWGGTLIRIGLIVAVLGAYLAWQLLAADVLFAAARGQDLPGKFQSINRHGAPGYAVLWTSILVTVILLVVQFVQDALSFSLDLTASLALIPYTLASAYLLKIALTGAGYAQLRRRTRMRDLIIGIVATGYALFLIWAAGYIYLMLACLLLAPATIVYALARHEYRQRLFTRPALAVLAGVIACAVAGVVLLASGAVQL